MIDLYGVTNFLTFNQGFSKYNEKEMTNIYDLANELSRGLRDLPEYKAVVASKEAIDTDPTAKALFDDYLAFQHELQAVIQSGQMPSAEQQTKIQEFAGKIQGNSVVNEFFAKQQQLSVYIGDLEKIIFDPIEDLFK